MDKSALITIVIVLFMFVGVALSIYRAKVRWKPVDDALKEASVESTTTYTFTGQSLGKEDGSRRVFIAGEETSGTRTNSCADCANYHEDTSEHLEGCRLLIGQCIDHDKWTERREQPNATSKRDKEAKT